MAYMRRYLLAPLFATMLACGATTDTSSKDEGHESLMKDRELIVVAAPRNGDPYYAKAADDIFDFHLAYAAAVEGRDDFLVLTDAQKYDAYSRALGKDRVLVAPQDDIWTRDFSPSNTAAPVMFRYTAEGQGGGHKGQSDADHVQESLAALMEDAGLIFGESDYLNDGGNFVDDYHGRAVISRKFLRDNGLTEAQARTAIISETSINHVAFIDADEQGGLEHADGVVAFIDANVLVINAYPEDKVYAATLKEDLQAGLPGVTIHEIITPYDGSEIYDDKFGSACGLYTNMLVTPQRIYFPQFDIPEDKTALDAMRQWTSKEIVPVRSDTVCYMGGGVRCMSWQLRGENAAKLKAWAASLAE